MTLRARVSRRLYRIALRLYGIRPMHLEIPLPPARPWTSIPSPEPVRPFKGPPLVSGFADRPSTYRDPAPPVEVASPPPPRTPDHGARLVILAGVLGFLFGYALAVMS